MDSLQKFIKQNDHPFLHPIYDMAIPDRNIIRFPSHPNVMLLTGLRHEGNSSSFPEAWFIVDTEESFPTGQATIKVGGSRIFTMLEWPKADGLPRQFVVRAPNLNAYKAFANADLLSWLVLQSCIGFRTEGNHIELCFKGNVDDKTLDTLYPKVQTIVDRFRSLSSDFTSSRAH